MSTVLVVDDDSSTRMVLRMILERDGHQVVEAEHGEAALAHIPTLLPAMVTTDLTMPVLSDEALHERLKGIETQAVERQDPCLRPPLRAIATRFTPVSTVN